MNIKQFTFNTFQENTFLIWDETKECLIIDPGCYEKNEKEILKNFIEENRLKPIKLINTHCHIDHVFGNKFSIETWNLDLHIHKLDLILLENTENTARAYGFDHYEASPYPKHFLAEGDQVEFGNSKLDIIFTPGHSPGHICLSSKLNNFIISGDVLFNGSIGRTDLPGGDFDTLIQSIQKKIMILEDETIVYCGHGPSTTIGKEKQSNPFLT